MEFTKEKKSEKKIYPILDFLKVKYNINRKKKKKKINHYTLHSPHSKY